MKQSFISVLFVICALVPLCCQESSDSIVTGAFRFEAYVHQLKGKSVGVVVNHSSLVGEDHLVDVLIDREVNVSRIFAPEHGFRGEASAGEKIEDGKDAETGLPIISLYGDQRKPSQEQIGGLDVIVFDIQDVGVRFYTYISTMHLMMEACAEAGIPMIVLDRPNPNGYYVDGPVLKPDYKSFIGMHEIPVVYGLTIGELAKMINGEGWLEGKAECDLIVIPCKGYDHTMTYDLPVKPSPNLPNLRSILLYPSLCFFEGTTVSIGRGTDHQFQVIGHPDFAIGSYTFEPMPKPGAVHPKHEGLQLYGTGLMSLGIEEIMSWKALNLSWLIAYNEYLAPRGDFFLKNNFFDKLAGTDALRIQISQSLTEDEIRATWQQDIEEYKVLRSKYLLYTDFE